jgi:hypothetical protein
MWLFVLLGLLWLITTVDGLQDQTWWGFLLLAAGSFLGYLFARAWRPGTLLTKTVMSAVVLSVGVALYLGVGQLRIEGKTDAAFRAGDGRGLAALLETGPRSHRVRAVQALGERLRDCPEIAPGFAPAVAALSAVMANGAASTLRDDAQTIMLDVIYRVVLQPVEPRFEALTKRAKPQSNPDWRPRGRLLWMDSGHLSSATFTGMNLDAARSALADASVLVRVWEDKEQVGVYKRADAPDGAQPAGSAYEVREHVEVFDIKGEVRSASATLYGGKAPATVRTSSGDVGKVTGAPPDVHKWLMALPEK